MIKPTSVVAELSIPTIMHLPLPEFFLDRPATTGEQTAIAESVASLAQYDVEEITYLLCNLSTAERATILLDRRALLTKIDDAQRVIDLQGPPPLIEVKEDDYSPP